jgi:hypothetical protein
MRTSISLASRLRIHPACYIATLACLGWLCCSAATFTDGDFANWSFSSLADPGSSATFSLVGNGNPGLCLQCTTVSGLAYGIAVANWATWNPFSDGPISNVTMTIDVKSISGWGGGQGIKIVAIQGGKLYMAPITQSATGSQTSWHAVSLTCGSSDFLYIWGPWQYDFTAHPDFTATGGVVQFGFYAGNSSSGTYTQLYDNWYLTVIPAQAAPAITNVTVLQRTDATGLVDIHYD